MASYTNDGIVKLWDLSTGRQIGDDMRGYYGVRFSPDGSRLVGEGIWDTATGTELAIDFAGSLSAFAYADQRSIDARGSRLLTWIYDPASLTVWDLAGGRQIGTSIMPGQPIHSADLSSDGTRLLAAPLEHNQGFGLWDATSLAPVTIIDRPSQYYSSDARFTSDGSGVIASWDENSAIGLWDASSGALLASTKVGSHYIRYAIGTHVLTFQFDDNTMRFWDIATGKQLGKAIPGKWSDGPYAVASTDQSHLLVSRQDGKLRIVDAQTGAQPFAALKSGFKGNPVSADINADGTRVFWLAYRGLQLWDAKTGKPVGKSRKLRDGSISADSAAAFNVAGSRILVRGDYDTAVDVIDTVSGKLIGTLPSDAAHLAGTAFDASGSVVASWTSDGAITLWNAAGDP
jgi:WD40 repeat protein